MKTRTKSCNGKTVNFPAIRPGAQVVEDGEDYFITSLNVGKPDAGQRSCSVSGTTIDPTSADEAYPLLFEGYAFDHVSSLVECTVDVA